LKTCVLIPIYDHKEQIRGVLDSLEKHGLDCIVIDDGSGIETRMVLDAAEKDYRWLEVYHRDVNGGRGAALATGYRLAAKRGFSHAIQLDADGQHNTRDVPRFVEAIDANPEALVLGSPIFDETAPKSRLYGRQLSRFMVWLTTLSLDVSDPLCGFRGIPLEPTLNLLDRTRLGQHMEFDPQLVIQLCWRGLLVLNLPTRVVYDSEGLSHFDFVRDNLRLIGVYSRALGGMLLRLPRLLTRRASPAV
jgi:glycosyltransferase involved in cell wall biosynthesis